MWMTTLNKIREHSPCAEGWKKLLEHLGKTKADDDPLSIIEILDSNGFDDALWCLRTVDDRDREIRLLAVEFARAVKHMMHDPRSIEALDVAERYANGLATASELAAARAAAALASTEGSAARAAAWAADGDAVLAAAAARAAAADAAAQMVDWDANCPWDGYAPAAAVAASVWEAAAAEQEEKLREIAS